MTVLPVFTSTLATVMLSVRTPVLSPAASPPMSRKLTRRLPFHGSSCLTGAMVSPGTCTVGKMAAAVWRTVIMLLAVSAKGAMTLTQRTPTTMPETTWPVWGSRLGPRAM